MADPESITESEEWRPVVGYEGLYEASSLGRVRQVASGRGRTQGRILAQCPRPTYLSVGLYDGKRRWALPRYVHRLVAMAFHGVPAKGMVVNHIDADITHNRPQNLEWVTAAGNVAHCVRLGRIAAGARNGTRTHPERVPRGEAAFPARHPERLARGELHGQAKLTEADVRRIRALVAQGFSQARAGRAVGVSRNAARSVALGLTWAHVK